MMRVRVLFLALPAAALVLAQPNEARWREQSLAGTAAMQSRDYAAAIRSFEGALAEAEKWGASDQRLAATVNNLAMVHRTLNRYQQAAPLFRRALSLYEKTAGSDAAITGTIAANLGNCLRADDKFDEALPLLTRSLAIAERHHGIHSLESARVRSSLGLLHLRAGRPAVAVPIYLQAIQDVQELAGGRHPELPSLLRAYGASLRGAGKAEEAKKAEAEAARLEQMLRKKK
jgi:tetratricopeptide (TPR) repeat protein